MPQTVFTVGTPITSRLKLGVVPAGDTVVALDVYRPDGTAIADPTISPWVADEKTAQFYATDDGTGAGATTPGVADGDWLVVWRVAGTGATVAPKVYSVAPLPGTGIRPEWSPFLSDVAKYVMRFTVDTLTPGLEIPLGTFTGNTNPTDEQAQDHIDDAAAEVEAQLGVVAEGSHALAKVVTSLRAAAAIARSFARSATDLATADSLDRAATRSMETLIAVDAAASPAGDVDSGLPYWSFPDPPTYADTNL
jgi:hypothetical protein